MIIYHYPSKRVREGYKILSMGFVGFSGLLLFIRNLVNKIHQETPIYVWVVLLFMPLLCLYSLFGRYMSACPLGVSEEGLAIFLFGRQYKFINWGQVKKIEKIMIYNNNHKKNENIIWVYGNRTRIRIDDWIDDFPQLLNQINNHLVQYHIPAFAVDRGWGIDEATLQTVITADLPSATRKSPALIDQIPLVQLFQALTSPKKRSLPIARL